jgi:hypothetical protein
MRYNLLLSGDNQSVRYYASIRPEVRPIVDVDTARKPSSSAEPAVALESQSSLQGGGERGDAEYQVDRRRQRHRGFEVGAYGPANQGDQLGHLVDQGDTPVVARLEPAAGNEVPNRRAA